MICNKLPSIAHNESDDDANLCWPKQVVENDPDLIILDYGPFIASINKSIDVVFNLYRQFDGCSTLFFQINPTCDTAFRP